MRRAGSEFEKLLLSGDEAVALAALNARVKSGSGSPGTASTEILEAFERLGGRAHRPEPLHEANLQAFALGREGGDR